ncbi:MAG: ABC transporter permease [Planctomycetales bacterium]|nr:ABC transporter permease [Planctomycetales bacterium]
MWRFAYRNLRVRKVRTGLSFLGLAVAVAGVIGLVSLSAGIREVLRSSLSLIGAVGVIREKTMDPIFSSIPETHLEAVRVLPEVRGAAAEVWILAANVEGVATLTKSLFSAAAIGGVEPEGSRTLRGGGFYRRHLVEGRWIEPGDELRDPPPVAVSRKLTHEYGKRLGDPIRINGKQFEVVGIYHTGSLFLDQGFIAPFEVVRKLSGKAPGLVSNLQVDPMDTSEAGFEAAAHAIERACPGVEALTPRRWLEHVGGLLGTMDVFLVAVSSFAFVVGAIGVVNTMLMSVSERVREFGILKAVGWTRGDVARLIVVEAAGLGVAGGIVGAGLGLAVVEILGGLLPFEPLATPWVIGAGAGGALGLAVAGGLYPAWRAASLDPVRAIRYE